MRINLISNIQRNNYNKENNKKTSFGAPQKELKKFPLEYYIPTPKYYIDYANKIKAEAAERAKRQKEYNEGYMKELSVKYNKTYNELQERENATSTYYAGFADHHND